MKKKRKYNFKKIAFLIFMIYATYTLTQQQFTIARLRRTEQEYQARNQDVYAQSAKLKTMIDNTSTAEYIEKMAREQLGLVKPGEKIFINQAASAPDTNVRGGGN